jgi:hypothetical protein
MLANIVEWITSKDFFVAFFAAFFGALSAFLFEAYRSWRSDRHKDLVAGNEAIFALSQMYTHATNINNQLFKDRAKLVQQLAGRDPFYFEFMPMEIAAEQVPRVQLDRLLFLLRSHAPDLLNRLAGIDREFGVIMKFLEHRNEAQKEFQRKTNDAWVPDLRGATLGQLQELAGPELCQRLEKMTENLRMGLPTCASDLMAMTKQVTDVLKFEFPFSIVAGFDPIERDSGFAVLEDEKPRTWRRLVRWLSRLARKPIRLPRKKKMT